MYLSDHTAVILHFKDAPVMNKQEYLGKSCTILMHSNFMALQHVFISYIQMDYSRTAFAQKNLNWSISGMRLKLIETHCAHHILVMMAASHSACVDSHCLVLKGIKHLIKG